MVVLIATRLLVRLSVCHYDFSDLSVVCVILSYISTQLLGSPTMRVGALNITSCIVYCLLCLLRLPGTRRSISFTRPRETSRRVP
ncbi:hypothetical protein V1511DRAFT_499430 [Dipodascopsis uninucleata]